MPVVGRALVFAAVALVASVLIDVLLWGGYQGFEPRESRDSLLAIHGLLHGIVFIAAVFGASFSFALLRHRLPSPKTSSMLGLGFGSIALFAAAAAMAIFEQPFGPAVLVVSATVLAGLISGIGGAIFGIGSK